MAEKMTAEEARTFHAGPSLQNMATLAEAAKERGCTCQAYEDWFTYKRWQAQGMQVQKGEKGTRIAVVVTKEGDDGKTKTYPKKAYVFCRCQVAPIGEDTRPPESVSKRANATTTPHNTQQATETSPKAPQKTIGDAKLATRFRKMADNLTKRIEHGRRDMTQNPTPRRMSQYKSRLHDANNDENLQQALRALADLHEHGECPPILADLRVKDDIRALVRLRWDSSGGYYGGYGTQEFADDSEAGKALQALITGDPEEREAARKAAEIQRLEGEARLKVGQIPGFFPTPRRIALEVVQLANIEPGMTVLEPSAGSGALADVAKELYPNARIGVMEYNHGLCSLLERKGYEVIGNDFLSIRHVYNGSGGFDRIVMNPPFENGQDVDHVRHAYDWNLKPGGRMVAIMSEHAFFATDRKSKNFRAWIDEVAVIVVDLPAGAFQESGTGVKTRIVVIDK